MAKSIIEVFRGLMPLRPLTIIEPLRVADLQAAKFLAMAGLKLPPVVSANYDRGIQRLDLSARRFRVSQMAMRARLLQLGIVQPQARCLPYRRDSQEATAIMEGVSA